jgi:hypothetical protein
MRVRSLRRVQRPTELAGEPPHPYLMSDPQQERGARRHRHLEPACLVVGRRNGEVQRRVCVVPDAGDDEVIDQAPRVACLVPVRPERRSGLETIDVSALRVNPETALVVAEQADHEIPPN